MKLFIIASEIPPVAGGIATYIANTGAMFRDSNNEITIFSRSNKDNTSEKGNVKTIEILPKDIYTLANSNKISSYSEKHPSFPYNAMGYWSALSYQLSNEVINYIRINGKPDIIESEDYSGLAYFLMQRKLLGCIELENVPIILTLHSSQYMLYPASKMPSYQLTDYWVGRMEKFCTLAADGIVAPTRYIAKNATDALGKHLDIEIIPLPAPKKLLDSTKIPKSKPTTKDVIYFGRLEIRKGIIPLIEACKKLWDSGLDFNLTAIGGDTWYHAQGCHMKTYVNEKYYKYIEQGKLILSSPLKSLDLYERISKAWCVVIPSLWENYPNTCLESMLLGKVVLASSDGGHVEMLGSDIGKGGFIFDWSIINDFESKLTSILSLDVNDNLKIGEEARNIILDISGHENVLKKRISHLERVIEAAQNKRINFFPSVNYKPHGKIDLPSSIPLVDSKAGVISVCIPFFNHGKYIKETLDSVYASDYPKLEVIVLNDGSDDEESLSVLANVEREYQDIKVIHSRNQGVAAARNRMVEIASGEYIAFLDSDDKVTPSFYTQAAKVLNKYENVGFVASWLKEFGNSDKVWITWNTEFPYLLGHNTIGMCTLVKKTVYLSVGGMKSTLAENLEDYECWITISEKGWLGVVIPEFHFLYRIRSDSRLSSSNRDQLLYLYEMITSFHKDLYLKYGDELYSLLNQNGSSWIWDNPSKSLSQSNADMTGMEIVSLVANKFKKVIGNGGIFLLLNRSLRIAKSLIFSRFFTKR